MVCPSQVVDVVVWAAVALRGHGKRHRLDLAIPCSIDGSLCNVKLVAVRFLSCGNYQHQQNKNFFFKWFDETD